MSKKIVKITEDDIKSIINESVNRILNENHYDQPYEDEELRERLLQELGNVSQCIDVALDSLSFISKTSYRINTELALTAKNIVSSMLALSREVMSAKKIIDND